MNLQSVAFFFSCYGDPPHLHSFPTRRSSDLTAPFEAQYAGWPLAPPTNPMIELMLRSEEHTSELQSRFDLVCRLLLEKKKRRSASPSITAGSNSPLK